MIALAIDENFDHHILRGLLRRLPHLDFRTVQSHDLRGADDREVLAWAATENRILVTHDVRTVTRFAYERVECGDAMPGVIEVSSRASIGDVLDDLTLLLTCSTAEECRGQVIYVPLR